MFSTFNKVVLSLVLIIVVAYFLQSRANTPEACAKALGVWDNVEQTCQTPSEKVIFKSLSKPHPVTLISPISEATALLNHAEQVGDIIYFRGQSSEGETFYLNMSQLMLLDSSLHGLTYFAAPFTVKTQDNTSFVYAGLFSYDFKRAEAKHLSAVLLGKEIKDTAITLIQKSVVQQNVFVQEGLVKFTFNSHARDQELNEYPTQKNEVLFQLVALDPNNNAQAAFRRIVRIHPSWDSNNDGINDCQVAGNCDSSIDYSQPKK